VKNDSREIVKRTSSTFTTARMGVMDMITMLDVSTVVHVTNMTIISKWLLCWLFQRGYYAGYFNRVTMLAQYSQ
jgi:hypothetical protein